MNDMTTLDLSTLPPDERAQAVLASTKTETYLHGLVEEAATITQVIDADSREQAHRVGMKLKYARTTIKKTGKAARDDATAFANAVIKEEKRLISITEAEETRVMGLRDGYDAVIEAAKQAKAKRDAEIQEKIAGIRALPQALAFAGSEELVLERDALLAFTPPEDVFGAFTDECKAALAEAIAALNDLITLAVQREETTAAVAAEKARLEADRRALEEERAAYEAERLAFEQRKLAEKWAKEEAERTDSPATPEQNEAAIEEADAILENLALEPAGSISAPVEEEPEATPEPGMEVQSDWRTRIYAMFTADQFEALAAKVNQCGFYDFATDLSDVAAALRSGAHDARLEAADKAAMQVIDEKLLDATVQALDLWTDQEAA